MVYRVPQAAPQSQVPSDRRGRVMGHFCLICATIYPLHRASHTGQPVYGRDHIASTCAHEGEVFSSGESWWEPAVEVLPAAAPQPVAATPAAGSAAAPAPTAALVPAAAPASQMPSASTSAVAPASSAPPAAPAAPATPVAPGSGDAPKG